MPARDRHALESTSHGPASTRQLEFRRRAAGANCNFVNSPAVSFPRKRESSVVGPCGGKMDRRHRGHDRGNPGRFDVKATCPRRENVQSNVSRETLSQISALASMTDKRSSALSLIDATSSNVRDLDIFIERLARWRKITNLVSDAISRMCGQRHIADCGQLVGTGSVAKRWVDMGSGAGFPGMVIAILLKGIEGAEIHCIESDRRKCAFLREVARATGAPRSVHPTRVEAVDARSLLPVDAVTARALAPLSNWSN